MPFHKEVLLEAHVRVYRISRVVIMSLPRAGGFPPTIN